MLSEEFREIYEHEVYEAIEAGEIIQQYPEDKPYASCLVLGKTKEGRPLHIVCAPIVDEEKLVIITVYQPDPAKWNSNFRRRVAR